MASIPSYQQSDLKRQRAAARPAARQKVKRAATWAQLLPLHRRTVIAKTLMLVALGIYLAGARITTPGAAHALLLCAALWLVLYALNEAYDLELEDHRAPPAGAVGTLYATIALLVGLAWALSARMALLFALMTAGQIAYCVPGVRLKRLWWPVLLLSGVANPLMRIGCGAIWGSHPLSAIGVLTPVVMHFAATIRTRATQRTRDERLGYRVAPPGLEVVGAVCTTLGIVGGLYGCIVGIYPRIFLIYAPFSIAFAIYAWSHRARSMSRLRQGWVLFAVGSVFGLAVLLAGR